MSGKAFIIHLKRAESRKAHVEGLIKASPLTAEIVDAVDGKELSPAERSAVYVRQLHRPIYPFELRDTEIGCFLSHRRCWQRIVELDLPFGMIFEDDAKLDPQLAARALEVSSKHIDQYGYIQFPVRPIADGAKRIAEANGCRLLLPKLTPLRASGQIVSQSAAKHLLKITEVIDRPVDTFLQMFWLTDLKLAAVEPSGLTDRTVQAGGSTIAQEKPLGDRLMREVKRGWYRQRIKIFSMRPHPDY